jgi:hypothetical protein
MYAAALYYVCTALAAEVETETAGADNDMDGITRCVAYSYSHMLWGVTR